MIPGTSARRALTVVMLEMLIVDRAWSEREPTLFAENFRNAALAVIASSPKMNEPARVIASQFVSTFATTCLRTWRRIAKPWRRSGRWADKRTQRPRRLRVRAGGREEACDTESQILGPVDSGDNSEKRFTRSNFRHSLVVAAPRIWRASKMSLRERAISSREKHGRQRIRSGTNPCDAAGSRTCRGEATRHGRRA
jgi:hypothetical protein